MEEWQGEFSASSKQTQLQRYLNDSLHSYCVLERSSSTSIGGTNKHWSAHGSSSISHYESGGISDTIERDVYEEVTLGDFNPRLERQATWTGSVYSSEKFNGSYRTSEYPDGSPLHTNWWWKAIDGDEFSILASSSLQEFPLYYSDSSPSRHGDLWSEYREFRSFEKRIKEQVRNHKGTPKSKSHTNKESKIPSPLYYKKGARSKSCYTSLPKASSYGHSLGHGKPDRTIELSFNTWNCEYWMEGKDWFRDSTKAHSSATPFLHVGSETTAFRRREFKDYPEDSSDSGCVTSAIRLPHGYKSGSSTPGNSLTRRAETRSSGFQSPASNRSSPESVIHRSSTNKPDNRHPEDHGKSHEDREEIREFIEEIEFKIESKRFLLSPCIPRGNLNQRRKMYKEWIRSSLELNDMLGNVSTLTNESNSNTFHENKKVKRRNLIIIPRVMTKRMKAFLKKCFSLLKTYLWKKCNILPKNYYYSPKSNFISSYFGVKHRNISNM